MGENVIFGWVKMGENVMPGKFCISTKVMECARATRLPLNLSGGGGLLIRVVISRATLWM